MTTTHQISLRAALATSCAVLLLVVACIFFGAWLVTPTLLVLVTAVAWTASDPPPRDRISFPFRLILITTISAWVGANLPLLLDFTGQATAGEWFRIGMHLGWPGIVTGLGIGALVYYRADTNQRASLLIAEILAFTVGLAKTVHWVGMMNAV